MPLIYDIAKDRNFVRNDTQAHSSRDSGTLPSWSFEPFQVV